MILKEIHYDTPEYEQTRELRNRLMRAPIGLSIYEQDYTFEVNSRMMGFFEGERLLGCSIIGKMEGEYCLDFLCIDDSVQKTGIGSKLLTDAVNWVKRQGGHKLILEARMTAKRFYEKHGFEAYGEVYLMEKSPVDHIMMKKSF